MFKKNKEGIEGKTGQVISFLLAPHWILSVKFGGILSEDVQDGRFLKEIKR